MPLALGYFPSTLDQPAATTLYGALHLPPKGAPPKTPPVLLIPPLFEERKSSYATLHALASALANAGHPALQFDFQGSGESSGDPGTRRWRDLAENLAAAHQQLAAGAGQSPLWIGLRLGATLALLEAHALRPAALAALAPVCVGATQVRHWRMRSRLRSQLTSQPADAPAPHDPPQTPQLAQAAQGAACRASGEGLDMDGFRVAEGFLQDCRLLDLLQQPPPLPPSLPVLLLQVSHRQEPGEEIQALGRALGGNASVAALRMEPFWERLDQVENKPLLTLLETFLRGLPAPGATNP